MTHTRVNFLLNTISSENIFLQQDNKSSIINKVITNIEKLSI